MLVAGQPEVFQPPLWCLPDFVVPSHKPWLLEYVHFLSPFIKILIVAASLSNLHLLASHLK